MIASVWPNIANAQQLVAPIITTSARRGCAHGDYRYQSQFDVQKRLIDASKTGVAFLSPGSVGALAVVQWAKDVVAKLPDSESTFKGTQHTHVMSQCVSYMVISASATLIICVHPLLS